MIPTYIKSLVLLFALSFSGASFSQSIPTNVTAVSIDTGIVLSWSDTGDESYRVYRDGIEIALNILSSSYTDTNVVNGSMYNYAVLSCNGDGVCSELQGIDWVTFSGGLLTTSDDSSCVVSSASSSNAIATNVTLNDTGTLLTWVAPADSVKWNVYRNNQYEFTIDNGIPAYEVENHVDGNSYYITSIFSDGSISARSLNAGIDDTTIITDCSTIQLAYDNLILTNTTLNAQILLLETDLAAALLNGGTDTTQLEADLLAANTEITTLNAQILILETDLAAALAGTDLAALQAQLTQAQADNVVLTTTNATLTADNSVLTADLATAQTDLLVAQTALTTAQADTATAQALQATAEADLIAANADLLQCETDLATTEGAALVIAADLATAQADLVTVNADLVTAQTDLAACLLLVP